MSGSSWLSWHSFIIWGSTVESEGGISVIKGFDRVEGSTALGCHIPLKLAPGVSQADQNQGTFNPYCNKEQKLCPPTSYGCL